MASISTTCPYCTTERAAFRLIHAYHLESNPRMAVTLMRCSVCECGVVGLFECPGERHDPCECTGDPAGKNFRLLGVVPDYKEPNIPAHLPSNVQRPYEQAEDNIRRANWDAAGTMYRKVLDVSTKLLDPNLSKKPLAARIDDLGAALAITPEMQKWAHVVRLGGNDAVHDDDPFSEEEAKDLQSFTEVFVQYAFTLPEMLKLRKPATAAIAGAAPKTP